MPIAYSKNHNLVIGNRIAIGHKNGGHQWERRPEYLITCRCGQPLRAYFTGIAPYNYMNDFGIGENAIFPYWLVKYATKGWGFRVADGHICPKCHNHVYFGASYQEAVWNYLQHEFEYSGGEKARMWTAIEQLVDNIRTQEAFRNYFALQQEELTGRPDCYLIVAPNTPLKIEERIKHR